MTIWLKQVITFWLMPLQLALSLIVAGMVLGFSKRFVRLGRALALSGFAVLLVSSNRIFSKWLIGSLEAPYSSMPEFVAGQALPEQLAACEYVVVLGGGHAGASYLPAINALHPSSLFRLGEGIRLVRQLPNAKLVLSGAGMPGEPSHAMMLARAAASLGMDRDRIVLSESPRDTESEAAELKRALGPTRVAVVTSAWHMRRAVALLRQQGLDVLPCPTDFLYKRKSDWDWNDWMWDAASLTNTSRAAHEHLGYLWAWLRKQVPSN